MPFTPDQALSIVQQYTTLYHEVYKMKKVFVIKETYNHVSGKTVRVSITVPISYNLNSGGTTEYYTTSSMNYEDKENLSDWIKLGHAKYKDYNVHCGSIKSFLELPDWTDDMKPAISSELVDKNTLEIL